MSCCGKKRQQLAADAISAAPHPTVTFEYTGTSAFAVIGPASGNRYAFEEPGARVEVDARDWRFLATVQNLRRAR